MRVPEGLTPLRDRQFAWYYASRVTNTMGNMMAGVALAFAVLDITGSASALGQVLAAATIPMVVFLLFGGVIADRFPRAVVLQLSNIASGVTQAAVAYLVISGRAELWMLIALEAVHGLVAAVAMPAMSSMVAQLVPRGQLQSANALLSLSRGGLTIVGPTVSALLVVQVGAGWALAADAATWFLSAGCLAFVRMPPRPRTETPKSTLRELREGWRLFAGTRWLWVVVLAFGFLNAIHTGAWFTLGPAIAEKTIGKQGWGMVLSAESFGLVAMTLVLLRVRIRRPLYGGMLGCALMGLPMLILGERPHLALLMVASFVAGAGIEVFSIGWNIAMQENVEESMLSRAYSYDALGSFVAMPVGQLAYGPLGEAFGYRDVLLVSGFAYLAIALVTLTSRSVRDLRRVETPAVLVTEPG